MNEQLLRDLEDVRKAVDEALRARLAGVGGIEGPRSLEVILRELDEAAAAVRGGKLPPHNQRLAQTARIVSDWYPRTPLGDRIAEVVTSYFMA